MLLLLLLLLLRSSLIINYWVIIIIIIIIIIIGEGGVSKDHKTSLHAIARIVRNEGFFGIYTG